METFESVIQLSNIILFLIVFMSLAAMPMLWTRIEARKLREETDKLAKLVERLERENDCYTPSSHSNLRMDTSDLAKVNRKYTA